MMVIRLAEHDPIVAKDIEDRLTKTEIAQVYAVKVLDHQPKDK